METTPLDEKLAKNHQMTFFTDCHKTAKKLLAFLLVLLTCQTKAQETPNIIFFLVDDMGWQETSVPFWTEKTELNKRYQTPNMEKLSQDGMKFTQAYAYPVCSPSRVSLMTGMNSARHRVTNWTLHKGLSPGQNHEINPNSTILHKI